MKKIILTVVTIAGAAASMSAQAATATICSGGGAGQAAAAVASDATSFIKTGFTPKCSANVHLVSDDQTTYYRVGAASVKGKNGFGGSTMGGAVSVNGACAVTGCAVTDASSAATNAASA